MFKRVLIANRGEIALRIIRACKEMGIETVAIYSTADKEALHVALADEAICIGSHLATDSYLKIKNIIAAAEIANVDAIHPGYGFLAENAEFAKICEECGFKFVGPSAEHIEMLGNKSQAKDTMKKIGVPVVPGSDGPVANAEEGLKVAKEIGFPVMIKASAGGGGKGMRIANNDASFMKNFDMARNEAISSFGSDEIYIEKFVEEPRHIEMQVFGDGKGGARHFFERECSIQRRHQKLLEEAPSTALDETLRKNMAEASLKAVKELKYENAGTIEYLVDKHGNFYFMEMNTRIQVEHPVTEMITRFDLLKLQFEIASGDGFSMEQKDIQILGHAIECRINAEDPETFMPSPGVIDAYYTPGGFGVRIDSAAYQDYTVLPFYDSMIAKLIVFSNTRKGAIRRAKRCLDEFIIEGIKTTIPIHEKILDHHAFVAGEITTDFIERYFK